MAISIFDLFKIGIGPSSSHTVGPMRAARLFAQALEREGLLDTTCSVKCELYGSLGATGKGHGSDVAVMLGLMGHAPDTVDVEAVPTLVHSVRARQALALLGSKMIAFREQEHLLLNRREAMAEHPNGMKFSALAGRAPPHPGQATPLSSRIASSAMSCASGSKSGRNPWLKPSPTVNGRGCRVASIRS